MNEDIIKLACLLLSYEIDRPHTSSPDLDVGDESQQHYPEITSEQFKNWLTIEHCGDCVNLAATCPRCTAEDTLHQANWLYKKGVAIKSAPS